MLAEAQVRRERRLVPGEVCQGPNTGPTVSDSGSSLVLVPGHVPLFRRSAPPEKRDPITLDMSPQILLSMMQTELSLMEDTHPARADLCQEEPRQTFTVTAAGDSH